MPAKRLEDTPCAGCGQCLESCPAGCYIPGEGAYMVDLQPSDCIECGACVDVCPQGCLVLEPEEK